jgi:hypothetical protein
VQQRALEFGKSVSTELAGAPEPPSLPDHPRTLLSGLATQLRTVAKLIAVRNERRGRSFSSRWAGSTPTTVRTKINRACSRRSATRSSRFDDAMQHLGVS